MIAVVVLAASYCLSPTSWAMVVTGPPGATGDVGVTTATGTGVAIEVTGSGPLAVTVTDSTGAAWLVTGSPPPACAALPADVAPGASTVPVGSVAPLPATTQPVTPVTPVETVEATGRGRAGYSGILWLAVPVAALLGIAWAIRRAMDQETDPDVGSPADG